MNERKRKAFLWIIMIGALAALIYMQGPITFTPFSERLISEKEVIRLTAFRKLDSLSPAEKQELVPEILGLYPSADPQQQKFALYALRRIGIQNESVNETVLKALSSSSPGVQGEAVLFVGEVNFETARYVINKVDQVPQPVREELIRLFVQLPDKSGPAFVENLSNSNDEARSFAMEGLAEMEALPEGAEEALKGVLKDENRIIRFDAALALSKFDVSSQQIISVLQEGLKREENQFAAAEALGNLGGAAKKAAPMLENLLARAKDGFLEESYLKPVVAQALHKVAPRKTSQAALIWDLKNRNPEVRYRAAWFISSQAEVDRGLASELVNRLEDPDASVAARSLLALAKIGLDHLSRFQEKVTGILLGRVEKEMEKETVEGFSSLISQALGPLGTKIMPNLLQGLSAKKLSAETVDKIIQGWKPFEIKSLEAYLDYGDPQVRFLAALNLARVGERRKDLVPLLRETVSVSDELLKEAGDWASRIESL